MSADLYSPSSKYNGRTQLWPRSGPLATAQDLIYLICVDKVKRPVRGVFIPQVGAVLSAP